MIKLNIVFDMLNVNVCTCAAMKCQRLIVYSWKGFTACRKLNTKSQNERLKVDGIIYWVVDVSNVSRCIMAYVRVSFIVSDGVYVYVVQSKICGVLVKLWKVWNNGKCLHHACDQDIHMSDISDWYVTAIICFVAMRKIEINVAELLNASGLDIYLSDASGWNVSVTILIL
jgi:hypothetical protein